MLRAECRYSSLHVLIFVNSCLLAVIWERVTFRLSYFLLTALTYLQNEMSFCLQLSSGGKLRYGKKNALVLFLLFFNANKAKYQHVKIRHFFEIANLEIKRAPAESFSYNLLNFYNTIYFFLCRLPGQIHFFMISLRLSSKIHSYLRLLEKTTGLKKK